MLLELNVPTSWGDVTIGQYAELYPVLNSNQNTVLKTLSILSVVSGHPIDDLKKITATTESVKQLRDSVSFLNTMDDMCAVPETPYFFIGQRRFSYNPLFTDMTAWQYIALSNSLEGVADNNAILYNNLHDILACLINEDHQDVRGEWVSEPWTDESYEELSELFKNHLTMDKAFPLSVFFCKVLEVLTNNMPDYLAEGEAHLADAQSILNMHGS